MNAERLHDQIIERAANSVRETESNKEAKLKKDVKIKQLQLAQDQLQQHKEKILRLQHEHNVNLYNYKCLINFIVKYRRRNSTGTIR